MHHLLACASILVFGPSVAQASCLQWADPATLSGTIEHRVFPGPPNFESIENGDAPRHVPILRLESSVCLNFDPAGEDGTSPALEEIRELQIVTDGREVEDGPATVSGELYYRQTGYHHTDVLIQLDERALTDLGDSAPAGAIDPRSGTLNLTTQQFERIEVLVPMMTLYMLADTCSDADVAFDSADVVAMLEQIRRGVREALIPDDTLDKIWSVLATSFEANSPGFTTQDCVAARQTAGHTFELPQSITPNPFR